MQHVNRAARLACVLIFGGAMVCGAQAQSVPVPLEGLGPAPQGGSLADIEANWGVTSSADAVNWGWGSSNHAGIDYFYYRSANDIQTWTFDKPVDLRFTVVGLNGRGEGLLLPPGTRCQVPPSPWNGTEVHSIVFNGAANPPELYNTSTADQGSAGAVPIPCQLAGASELLLNGENQPALYQRGLSQLIAAIPEITSGPPPATGTVGTPYGPFTVTANDSDPDDGVDLVYTVTAGTLPPGLTLDPNTGEISGTPTTGGSYTFTVVASNGPVNSLPRDYTIVVAATPVTPGTTTAVPTLDVWGLGVLAGALGWLGLRGRRRARPVRDDSSVS